MDRHEHRVVRVWSGDLRWCLFPKVRGVDRNCVALVAAADTLRGRNLVVTVGGRGPVRVAPGPAKRRGVWRQRQSQHDPENSGSKHVILSRAYYKTRAGVCYVRAGLMVACSLASSLRKAPGCARSFMCAVGDSSVKSLVGT